MSADQAVELAALRDRFEVDDLITAYANTLDDRDWPALRDLFTPDAIFDFTAAYGIAAPRDEMLPWLEGQVTREFAPEIQHVFANRSIRLDGDTASGRLDCFNPDVVNDGQGGQFLLMNGSRYTFEARRTDEGWRFTRLVGRILWSHRAELFVFSTDDEESR